MSVQHTNLNLNADTKARRKRSSGLRVFFEYLLTFAIALVVAVLIKTFLIQPFYIPSPSMNPTLLKDDKIIVSKLHPGVLGIERGDVIVFADPGNWVGVSAKPAEQNLIQQAFSLIGLVPDPNQQHLVKRLIAIGGDRVQCSEVGGELSVNGVELKEEYLSPGGACQTVFNTVVPEGKYFVMGDNRFNSADSAYHLSRGDDPFIDSSLVTGKAITIFLPFNRIGGVDDGAKVFEELNQN